MARLYTQLELINMLKLPPTTVKRWLDYFSYFVPAVRQGDSLLYKYETMKLLKRISELRAERYHLSTIVRLLIEEGFVMYNDKDGRGHGTSPVSEHRHKTEGDRGGENQHAQLVFSLTVLADELYRLAEYIEDIKEA